MPGPNTPYTQLDQQQILQQAFDETTDRLRVDAELTASIIPAPGLEVNIQAVDDNIAIRNSNNSNELFINPDGSINVTSVISGNPNINLHQVGGVATAVNNGIASIGTQRVVIASDNTPFTVNSAQLGSWTTGRTWVLDSATDSVAISNFPGSFSVTQGTSPWVVSGTVTSNIGTTGGLALDSSLSTINTTLGSPFQAGGSIGNTTFASTQSGTWNITNISGTVSLPTGAATLTAQNTGNVSLSSIDSKIPSSLTVTSTRLLVDGSGVIQPVSGTVAVSNFPATQAVTQSTSPWVVSGTVAATQSGTWNIGTLSTITNVVHVDDNGGSLTVDNAGTFAVQAAQSGTWNITNISGTVSLPTGAATETTLSSIKTDVDNLNLSQGSTTLGQKGNIILGAVTTSAPTYSTTQSNPLSLTTGGLLRVDASGTSISGTVTANQGTSPWVVSGTVTANAGTGNFTVVNGGTFAVQASQSGTWNVGLSSGTNQIGHLEANQSVNIAQINGITPLMGNGVTGTGSQRVTIASDNTAFSVNATLSAETTKVIGTVNQGTSPWVTSASQSGTWNINNISGTISLPTLAATSTKQSDGTQKTQIVDGSGNVIASQNNQLEIVQIDAKNLTQNITGTTSVTLNVANQGSIAVQVTGTFLATLVFEATIDGTNFFNWYGVSNSTLGQINTVNSVDQVFFNGAGLQSFRVRCSAYTSGTAVVSITANQAFAGQITGFGAATNSGGAVPVSVQGTISASISGVPTVKIEDSSGATLTANLGALNSNFTQINGVTVSTSNGVVGTGVQRVAIASDNTAFSIKNQDGSGNALTSTSNALDVNLKTSSITLPVSGTVAATQSGTWNVGLNAGTNIVGKVGIDQTTPGTTNLVALAANQSVNLAQIAGNTTSTGNGVAGTGVQRVTIASDNTAFSVNATLSAETTKVIGTVNISAGQTVGLVAGTAVIGHVINDASSAVIGHVITDTGSTTAVTGNVAVTVAASATNIAKAEDSASADADVGVGALAIRKATPANTSGTDGDYEFLQMSAGRLWSTSNVDQFGGTNVSTGAGAGGAGIPRVTISNDSSLAANQSVNISQINATTPLMGNGVTGTGSQRVTLASDTSSNTNPLLFNQSQINGVALLAGNGAAGTGAQRVTIASDNTAFSVNATPPTLTKGTQGSTGYSVQQLNNAGRNHINFYASGVASGATTIETAITMTKSAGTAATTSAASFVVTSGKTFRMTSITFGTRGNATGTAEVTTFVIRVNTAGAVTTSTTPIVLSARSGAAATALAYDRITIPLSGDGYEIVGDGTLQFGITANSVFTTNAPTWDILITGYEY